MAPHLPAWIKECGLRLLSVVPARLDPLLPENLDPRPKIFGIGFHKTGTTSLGRALRILGFRLQKGFSYNLPNKRIQIPEPVTIDKIRDVAFKMVPRYGAFEDSPWPLLFRDLDQAFPGSRFILTERDPQSWIQSATRHFGARTAPYLDLIYERENFNVAANPDDAIDRFLRHNAEVKSYFAGRSDDLLVWDIERDPDWRGLCDFLQIPPPGKAFPHGKNSAAK